MNAQLVRSAKKSEVRDDITMSVYDAARAEHLGSFPAFFNEVSSVCSLFWNNFTSDKTCMYSTSPTDLLESRDEGKHIRFFNIFYTITLATCTFVLVFCFSLPASFCTARRDWEMRNQNCPYLCSSSCSAMHYLRGVTSCSTLASLNQPTTLNSAAQNTCVSTLHRNVCDRSN